MTYRVCVTVHIKKFNICLFIPNVAFKDGEKSEIKIWPLLDVKGGRAGEENFGSIWVNVVIHPF